MTTDYPSLSPRGELSAALKHLWPGHFEIRRRRLGFGITLSHAALKTRLTMNIADRDLDDDVETAVKNLTRDAWACLLDHANRQVDLRNTLRPRYVSIPALTGTEYRLGFRPEPDGEWTAGRGRLRLLTRSDAANWFLGTGWRWK